MITESIFENFTHGGIKMALDKKFICLCNNAATAEFRRFFLFGS